MKSQKRVHIAALFVTLYLSAIRIASATFPYHTFDTGNQGWQVVGASAYAPPTQLNGVSAPWESSGNPAGSLVVTDLFSETWISSPAAFLGNQSNMYGKSFKYDIRIAFTDATAYPSVAIQNSSIALLYTIPPPPLGQWQTRIIPFDETLWRVGVASGPVATQAQMQSVLANLTGFYLLTEWNTGEDHTNIDNVGVQATAIPGDFDSDGDVDGADFVAWQTHFPTSTGATLAEGDADNDGDVDGADFVVWQTNFPDTPGPATSPVPEPAGLILALLSVPVVGYIARRRCVR